MRAKLLLLTVLISALPAFAGTISGQLQTATGGTVNNGTLTFTLSQPGVLSGTATLVTSAVSCYTSTAGNVVGVPDPLALPILSTNTASGTLAAATYFVKITYTGAGGESVASPENSVVLSAQGTVIVTAPAIQPASATGYKVYISSTTGTETLQGTVVGFGNYSQSVPLVGGAALPVSNTSSCTIVFSDQIIPTGTFYTVNLFNKNGSQIAGFPQTWCTYGGAAGTINVSNGAPTGNCGTNGVFYPTPIYAVPQNGAAQSISSPLTVTGPFTNTGNSTLTSLNNIKFADQFASVQAAINALPSTGGTVYLTCGTSYTGPTTFPNGTKITSTCPSGAAGNFSWSTPWYSTQLTYSSALTIGGATGIQGLEISKVQMNFTGAAGGGLTISSVNNSMFDMSVVCGAATANCLTWTATLTGGATFNNRIPYLQVISGANSGTSNVMQCTAPFGTFVTENEWGMVVLVETSNTFHAVFSLVQQCDSNVFSSVHIDLSGTGAQSGTGIILNDGSAAGPNADSDVDWEDMRWIDFTNTGGGSLAAAKGVVLNWTQFDKLTFGVGMNGFGTPFTYGTSTNFNTMICDLNGGVFSFGPGCGSENVVLYPSSGSIANTTRLVAGAVSGGVVITQPNQSTTVAGTTIPQGFTAIQNFSANTVALTADWTCGTGGTVASCTSATIIGSGGGVPLTFTLPLAAQSYTLECNGVVGQATAATANQWNLLTATNGATNVTANYSMATAATASAYGAVTDQASTTTTFQITPSWTLGGTGTKMPFRVWARIQGASVSGTVLSLQLVAPTVGDLVTIYQGTSCTVF